MNNTPKKGPTQVRIRSLRLGGEDTIIHTVPARTPAAPRGVPRLLLSRLAQLHATGSAAFLNWIIPYLKSPLSFFYGLVAIFVVGAILDATLNQAGEYLNNGYSFYAAFVYCQDTTSPHLSFWHYGLYYFIAPIVGVTTACIAGLVLAYISIGVGVGVVIWYAGWGTSNFSQYVLPGILALIQGGLMVTVFKRAANFIFGAVIWLYTIVVAAFWAFLLLFTFITWIHWLAAWSIRSAH